jgi:ATP-dependent helicase HrpB
MLAKRVAVERSGKVGEEIGYQVRFERVAGRNTRVCYVTEGVLLRRLLKDPQLAAVSAIIFDEFHERHLQGDVMLAMSLALQEGARPDLKIIVMSATLNSDALKRHLEPCRVVSSEGRAYPVEIKHFRTRTSTEKDVWDMVAAALSEEVIRSKLPGDVLVRKCFISTGYALPSELTTRHGSKWRLRASELSVADITMIFKSGRAPSCKASDIASITSP